MASADNPYLRQPWRVRAGRAAYGFFAGTARVPLQIVRTVRRSPLGVKILLFLTAVGFCGVGGYYLAVHRPKKQAQREAARGWEDFSRKAIGGADPEELKPLLDQILAASPNDPAAAQRKKALETLEADPSDQAMVVFLMRQHLKAGRVEAAAKEAAKRLAEQPNDYFSNCVAANARLDARDPAGAAQFLDRLVDPSVSNANPDPGSLLYAVRLLSATGRDTAKVRRFVVAKVVPMFRGEVLTTAAPGGQVTFVACYADAFSSGPDQYQALAGGWAPAARLMALATDRALAEGKYDVLTRVGELGPELAAGLLRLSNAKLVSDEEYATLSNELEERTRRAWTAVREHDPKSAAAYRGLASSFLRSRSVKPAFEAVDAGTQACPDDLPLHVLQADLLKRLDRAEVAYRVLAAAAERNPQDPRWWLLAADAASAAKRRDLALKACEKGRVAAPNAPQFTFFEAALWLEAGSPQKALPLFDKLNVDGLAKDAGAARPYVRTLTELGETGRADGFLAKCEASANAANNPAVIVAAFRGVFDAPPDAGRAAKVATGLTSVLARWGDDRDAAFLKAEALLRGLELGPADWDKSKAREAAQAFEVAVALNPSDIKPAAGLAWVRVRGGLPPSDAMKAAAPLEKAVAEAVITPEQRAVLASVYLANERPADAVRVLEAAARENRLTVGGLMVLARAYGVRGQKTEALAALKAASLLPQTARERADYTRTATQIQELR